MKTVFLLCAVFALRAATGPITEKVVVQANTTQKERPSALWPQLAGRTTKDKPHNGDSCLPGWCSYGSRCFKFFTTPMSWVDAENYCLYFGANLASIHNPGEHEFIDHLSSLNSRLSYWIGGSDAVKSSKWLWSDGSIVYYNNWGRGEPNDADNRENCIETISIFGWNDRSCEVSLPFVCGTRPVKPF